MPPHSKDARKTNVETTENPTRLSNNATESTSNTSESSDVTLRGTRVRTFNEHKEATAQAIGKAQGARGNKEASTPEGTGTKNRGAETPKSQQRR